MQKAQSRVRKAQQLTEEASSSLWPSINASGYAQRQRFAQYGLIPPPFNGKTFNIYDVGLNFKYEFDFWGKNRQMLAASVNEECAANADLAQARLIISAAVATTYFQLQNNTAQLSIARQILQQQQEILSIVQERATHGVESDIPVTTALANEEAARVIAKQYEALQKLSLHQLSALLGKNAFETVIQTPALSHHLYHVNVPTMLPANLLAQRPDIFATRSRLEATANKINVAKARFFPNINLSALFSYQSIKFGHFLSAESQNNAITGAIDLPIFDAGARRANLGVRYAEYDVAVSNYNNTILKALREVADQVSTLHSLQSQISAREKALSAIKHKHQLTTLRYDNGIIDYLPVLETKTQLLQQQSLQASLQSRHLQAIVAMMKALGGNDRVKG
jgi:NodT family efflux transporter outer membrane factor (OMF) lipoprotein